MAQGAVAVMPTLSNGTGQSADELREILEYERIVQFKDAVLAGIHPRVKIPPHLNGKQAGSVRNLALPALPSTNNNFHQSSNYATTPNDDPSSYFISANNQRLAGNNQTSKSGKSEIDPIFLQKSDDLIKAEMNLQRVRLERALRDQIEDQRQKAKASLQTSESLPSFDISEVLSKAQALVNPSTSAPIEPVLAAGDSPADDSFDENTFYSSQHDSSEWSNSSQGQKEPTEVQSHGLVSAEGRDGRVKSRVGGEEQVSSSLLNNQLPANSQHSQRQVLPGLGTDSINSSAIGAGSPLVNTGGQTVGKEIRGETSSQGFATTAQQHIDQNTVQHTADQLLRQAFEEDQASPLIRAHNLSPLAPQPARVSPLATAREPPILRENILANEAAPAQVTALRNQPAGNSSTDSSPKGNKGSEKRKAKKKKRNKAKDVGDSPDSPYIKPEPRSPSPYNMAPLPRPQKRQRQSGQYAAELNYDDQPRYESTNIVQDRAPERDRLQDARAPAYERLEDRYDQDGRRPEHIYRRIEREEDNYRRVSSDTFSRRPESPFAPAYAASQSRPTRAISHAVDRRIEEPTRYYKDAARTVLRPDTDRERSRSPRRSPLAMRPPRQPVRIVLDEHGREYIDPAHVPIPIASRQSVAPPTRYREGEAVYERAPMRAVSSRAPIEYEEDGVIFRRASPISAVPRRVITQPEYALAPSADYRSYREREYSARPGTMAPPGDDHQPARVVERRPMPQYDDDLPREYLPRAQSIRDEPPREYLSRPPVVREEAYEFAPRAMSVRPDVVRYESRPDLPREYIRAPSVRPVEPVRYESRGEPMREYDTRAMSIRPEVRYEVPREYPSRLQSVRPEAPPREYASSVRPEARRDMIAPPQREYSVRPMESSGLREVMAPPSAERYYEDGPRGRPAEIAYIERPRAREASVVVYADDTRREMYR